ncbi:MAG TPA: DNA translocase FtsK 4TM domain-containing protein, partial [Jatrophihabitans sp.]|nr:DNA translocase FtsK 4TM domain-containing protein [Jatrophihabitans sp.]
MSTGTRTRPSARKGSGRPAARSASRSRRSPAAAPFVALGRVLGAIWRGLAALVGGTARAAGRNAATARDLPPEHRRDGAALGVLAVGLISATAIWVSAAGPVGRALETACRTLVGNGALLVPVVLFLAGGHMLRQAPEPESRGRLLVGSVAITIAVLGLFDLWGNSPATSSGRRHAGGLIGSGLGKPLSAGLSAVLAVPVLTLVGAFGILVVTATPISLLAGYVRGLFGFGAGEAEDEVEDDEELEEAPAAV